MFKQDAYLSESSPRIPLLLLLPAIFLILLSACAEETSQLVQQDLALISVSGPSTYDFSFVTVGNTKQNTFTINNLGGVTATNMSGIFFVSAFSFWGGSYPGVGGTCSSSLEPGESCTVVVAFSPPIALSYNEAIRISYHNGALQNETSRPVLLGRGVNP